MGRRGPKARPTAEKRRRGNPGHQKLNRQEPEPPAADSLVCPPWLKDEARQYWERVAPEAARLGLLTTVDLEKFAAVCQAYRRWRQFERASDRVSAELAIAKGYAKAARERCHQFSQLAASFGFDPSSRSGVTAIPPQPSESAEQLRKKFFAV